MQGHHGALAETDKHEAVGGKPIAREFIIDEAIDGRLSRHHAAPVFAGIAHRQRKPLQAAVHAGDGLGCVGCNKNSLRQPAPPTVAERNQVVAVGAVPMQQHHQGRGCNAAWFQAWSVELFHLHRHRRALLFEHRVVGP